MAMRRTGAYESIGERSGIETDAGTAASRRRVPRQRRAEGTVASILEATLALAASEGFSALTTPQIAERAGVSIGSLYQYFPNRNAIYANLYDMASARCAVEVREIMLRMINEPPDKGMRVMVGTVLKVYERDALVLLKLIADVPQMRERTLMLSSFEALVRASVKMYLQLHLPKSSVRESETQLFALESSVVHAIQRFALERPPLVLREKLINDLAALVLHYVDRERQRSGVRVRIAPAGKAPLRKDPPAVQRPRRR